MGNPQGGQRIVVIGPDGQPESADAAVTAAVHNFGTEQSDGIDIDPAEQIGEPAKVMRIGSMIKQLLEEVRSATLDEASRDRLRDIYETSVTELGNALSPDLRAELARLAPPFHDDVPSEAELRIAKAQLVGWLEGLFHGI